MMMQMEGGMIGGMMGMGVLWWLIGILVVILLVGASIKLTKSYYPRLKRSI